MEAAWQNIRIQRWVLILSVVLLLGKIAAYYLTHSVAILTDALEAIVNVIAGLIGLYSLTIAAKPRDTDHPYGHGKIEFVSAAAEGLMIFVAGALILIEAIEQYFYPKQIKSLDVGMMLISVTALANFAMGALCLRTGRKNNSLALIASGKHLHSDAYSTLGILGGLILIYLTGIQWIDSAVAFAFSLFILYTGFKIIRSSVAGIMDETDEALLKKLVMVLDQNRSKNWIDLHNLRIIKFGGTMHVDCHVTVPWYMNVHEAHEEIEKIGNIVRQEFASSIELFIHTDGCLPISCPICIKDDCPVRYHPGERRISWSIANVQRDRKHQRDT